MELGILPLVGGDTDVGLGVGQLSTLAGVAPGVAPYRWALESAAFISYKPSPAPGGSSIPYQDYFVLATFPQLLQGRLRLQIRPSYTKETTQRFYGLGNAAPAPADDVPRRDFYGRVHPTLSIRTRYRLLSRLFGEVAAGYTYTRLDVGSTSTLVEQMQTASPAIRALLGDARAHGVLLTEGAVSIDTRDSEIDPEHGQLHQIKLRVSPRIGQHMPYSYQQIDVITRWYLTIVPSRLVAAARLVFDLQLGTPPFYELARYEDTFALGGLNGVRGVPGQRYYGKVKVFSNWELRSQLLMFRLFQKQLTLGAATFFDIGRLWADRERHPELDGTGWGLKYGVGGGIRLQQGKTFVARADIAWSPDARPIGGYVGAGHMF